LGATYRRPSAAQLLLALYALVGGVVSFFGWYADIPRLADWLDSGISIQPNAAIAVTCAALALLLLRGGYRRIAGALGVFISLIGATVLFEYGTGINLGIDDLLTFDRTWGRSGVVVPGRMGPPGALSWTALGLGFLCAAVEPHRWPRAFSAPLAVVGLTIAGLSIIGYLYGVSVLYTVPTVSVIALQTSTFILAVSLGLIIALPERAPMRLLDDSSPAGALARKMLPAVILVPTANP
jgi:hypothetical protein